MSSPFPNIPPDNKYNGPGSKNNIPRVTSEKVFQTQEEKTIVFQAVKIEQLEEKIFKMKIFIDKLKNTNKAFVEQNRNLMLNNNYLFEKIKIHEKETNSIIQQQQLEIRQLQQIVYQGTQQPEQQRRKPARPLARYPKDYETE